MFIYQRLCMLAFEDKKKKQKTKKEQLLQPHVKLLKSKSVGSAVDNR